MIRINLTTDGTDTIWIKDQFRVSRFSTFPLSSFPPTSWPILRLLRFLWLIACSSSILAAFPCKIVCRIYPPSHGLAVRSKPSLLAWITCDGVHIDPASGKHTILGVFSNIQARSFPVVHPYMVWFLTLTDVQPGKHMIKMSMGLDPTNPGELLHREFESQSPLHRINLINELRNLSFDQPGEYSILIEVDDEPILATNLIVS